MTDDPTDEAMRAFLRETEALEKRLTRPLSSAPVAPLSPGPRPSPFTDGTPDLTDEEAEAELRAMDEEKRERERREALALKCATFTSTDDGNAMRLIARYGEILRYDHTGERWLLWDGTRWSPDSVEKVMEIAKDTARAIPEEGRYLDESAAGARFKWAAASLSSYRVAGLLTMARSDPRIAITGDVLDRDPYLLNTPDGTVDLKTGEIRSHRKEDMITKTTTARYVTGAACPLWEDHIRKVCRGDESLVAWLRVNLGYSLLGTNPEMLFYVAYGTGKNGKSVTFRTVRAILGEYAENPDPSTFMVHKYEKTTRDDLLQLRGARFAFSSETLQGRRLNEALIKNFTGGDPLKKRALYSRDVAFYLPVKVWMASNYRPRVRDQSPGFWERLRVVPFVHYFPEEDRDPEIEARLLMEAPGILQWLILGLLQYWADGIPPCPAVDQAVADYRVEQAGDTGHWLYERCAEEAGARTSRKEALADIKAWAAAEGMEAPNAKDFTRDLEDRGFHTKPIGGIRYWIGFRLKRPEERDGQEALPGILPDDEYDRLRIEGRPLFGD